MTLRHNTTSNFLIRISNATQIRSALPCRNAMKAYTTIAAATTEGTTIATRFDFAFGAGELQCPTFPFKNDS
jgi:hypothetical protein